MRRPLTLEVLIHQFQIRKHTLKVTLGATNEACVNDDEGGTVDYEVE
jgi:hypothetical protein